MAATQPVTTVTPSLHRDPRRFRWPLLAVGAVLIGLAAFLTPARLERLLLGQATGSLAWGPLLFRALLAFHGILLLLLAAFRPAAREQVLSMPEPQRVQVRAGVWFALIGLTAFALALRIYGLNSCLWFDEVITLIEFVRPPLGTIITSFHSQNQHMLYSVLANVSLRLLGETPAALRLPSVLFGITSLWALFLLGQKLIGQVPALLACTLMAVSYHHLWFSQNARGYMGLLFLATLATWLWLEAMDRSRTRWWLLYAVTIALGMWVHLTMLFVAVAHALVHFGREAVRRFRNSTTPARGPVRALIFGYGLAGTLTLQLYALSLPDFFHGAAHESVGIKSEWTNPLWVVLATAQGLRVGWASAIVVVCAAILSVAGWLKIFRRDSRAAVAMVLPGILGTATMVTLSHAMWPRFFFFSLGFVLLVVVAGSIGVAKWATRLVEPAGRQKFGLALGYGVVGALILASLGTLPRYYALPKQDFTGALAFVERNRKPDDAVVGVGIAGVAYRKYFAPHWLSAETKAEFDQVRQQHPNLWVVYTIPAQLRSLDLQFWSELQRDFRVVRVFRGTLGDGELYVCLPRSVAATTD